MPARTMARRWREEPSQMGIFFGLTVAVFFAVVHWTFINDRDDGAGDRGLFAMVDGGKADPPAKSKPGWARSREVRSSSPQSKQGSPAWARRYPRR